MHPTKQPHIRAVLGFVLAGLCHHMTPAAISETVTPADRARVMVVPNDVTVDGKPRPDIAQALADSFAAGLLKAGDYRVFQAEVPSAKGKGRKGEVSLGIGSAGSRTPVDVDMKFAFNLVGQDSDYRFTLKKIRAADGEVLEVHELETHGKLDKVFGLVPNVLMKMQAKVKEKGAPVFPRTQSPAMLTSGNQPPAGRKAPVAATSASASAWTSSPELTSEYANVDFSKVPKALIYQHLGSVQFINEAWKFAIIRPQANAKLKLSDPLHILYDEDGRIYADLKIANFDSGRVIADFGNKTPAYHKIFPGDEVFGWAPPLR